MLRKTTEEARLFGDHLYFKGTLLLSDSQATFPELVLPDKARIIPDDLWEFLFDELKRQVKGGVT